MLIITISWKFNPDNAGNTSLTGINLGLNIGPLRSNVGNTDELTNAGFTGTATSGCRIFRRFRTMLT